MFVSFYKKNLGKNYTNQSEIITKLVSNTTFQICSKNKVNWAAKKSC